MPMTGDAKPPLSELLNQERRSAEQSSNQIELGLISGLGGKGRGPDGGSEKTCSLLVWGMVLEKHVVTGGASDKRPDSPRATFGNVCNISPSWPSLPFFAFSLPQPQPSHFFAVLTRKSEETNHHKPQTTNKQKMGQELILASSDSTIILSSILLLLISWLTFDTVKQWRIAASRKRESLCSSRLC